MDIRLFLCYDITTWKIQENKERTGVITIMRRLGRLAAYAVAGMMALAGTVTAQAESGGPGAIKPIEQAEKKMESGIDIARLKAAQGADQVIVVVGTGMDSAKVHVAYFTKAEDGSWSEDFYVPGYCGYNGMATDKREGDRRTPVGTYGFTSAFGILQDPGSILPYKALDEYDYWVDDSASEYYNQMVSAKTTPVTWKSAEHLIKVNPCYNYSIALDYNAACIPGKGSAIFLHGLHPTKTWTEGCIAIPESNMKTLVQQVDGETRIVIVSGLPELEYVEAAE